jgi:carbamoyltransferase
VAVAAQPARRSEIPAVVHVDGTARIQTVGPESDPLVRELLVEFAGLTGVPVILNTSFNTRGEPIVETFADALRTFQSVPIDALAAPPFLISRRPSE